LICVDLKRSRDFYRRLGLALVKESAHSLVFDLGGPTLHLHRLSQADANTYGLGAPGGRPSSGFCLDIANLRAWREGWTGPVALELHSPPWGGLMLMLDDPDGHRVELSQPTPSN
jgi:catechol 2,3-dioxygenase-like lactoylglutathione lyase family enzyme